MPSDLEQTYSNAAGDGVRIAGTGTLAATELLPPPPAGWRYESVSGVLSFQGTGVVTFSAYDGVSDTPFGFQLNHASTVGVVMPFTLPRVPAGQGLRVAVSGGTYTIYIGRALLVQT